MILTLLGIIFIILIFINYILPYFLVFINKDQNLKTKYGEWAIVTGGTSGIGLSIVKRLSNQGINLIVVSKEEDGIKLLHETINKNNKNNNTPNIEIVSILLDLSLPESVKELINKLKENQEKGIFKINDIRILFNNVGYLTMEGLNQTNYIDKLKMIQCNVLTSVELTDYFYRLWLEENNNRSAAIIFTSSITGIFPTPFSATYAAGKSFISSFAKSLSLESKYNNIDILAIQPGRVDTNLFQKLPNLLILNILKVISQKPDDIVDIMFRCVGKYGIVIFDSGLFGVLASFLINMVGVNINTWICYIISNYILKDFKKYKTTHNNKKLN